MKMKRLKETFVKELRETPISFLVSKWIIDKTPYIFGDRVEPYLEWKECLSTKIGVDSHAISFTGSSNLGFSLNPNKNFKHFDKDSDIDVAIISHHYFDLSWHFLRNLGAEIYKLNNKQRASVRDHVSRLIYWGIIATDKIIPVLPFGKEWVNGLSEMSKIWPTENRDINVRIFNDFEFSYTLIEIK